jgi:hypothetical protein
MELIQHKNLADGRWQKFTLMEQLGNIGSEVARALRWQEKDDKLFQGAVNRALELFDLTIQDIRWKGRLKEITRARDIFCDAISGGKEYNSKLKDLEHYFFTFALIARKDR